MTRTRSSAKAAGARFERQVADWLRDNVSEWIDRKTRTGARDTGDIANLRTPHGHRIVAELKDVARMDLAGWVAEAETERVNDAAMAGIVVHKRRGHTDPAAQYVTLTLGDLAAILTGTRHTASTTAGGD